MKSNISIIIKSIILTIVILVSYFAAHSISSIFNFKNSYVSGMWCAVTAVVVFDDQPTPKGALSLQLAFRVTKSEVDACAGALRKQGVKLIGEPTDQAWGHRTCFFRDPDGNVLEIYADL